MGKRRKLKESLESKETGDTSGVSLRRAEKSLQETIKKLQAEGENLLKKEEEKLRQEFSVKTKFVIADKATLKLKWKCKKDDPSNGGYSESKLKQLLQKYGPVSDIVVNTKRKGSALVVFNSIAAAKICMQKEKGLEGCPLSFRMLHETDTADAEKQSSSTLPPTNSQSCNSSFQPSDPGKFSSFPGFNVIPHTVSNKDNTDNNAVDRDYESLTLMRLRQAEERKRLIEEIRQKEVNDHNEVEID